MGALHAPARVERPPKPMSDFIELRSWGRYQHYSDRPKPPWIKLYPAIIDSRENPDLVGLPIQTRFLVFGLLCLAANTGNRIPASPAWLAVELGMTTPLARKGIGELRAIGFVRSVVDSDDSGEPLFDMPQTPKRRLVSALGLRARPIDEVWDTMAELFGPVESGTGAHKKRNRAVADLKRMGATSDSIRGAHRRWGRTFEGATPTDMALGVHYPKLIVGSIHAREYIADETGGS